MMRRFCSGFSGYQSKISGRSSISSDSLNIRREARKLSDMIRTFTWR
jgi:hypothetical protein